VFQLEKVNMEASREYCIRRVQQTHNRHLRDPRTRIKTLNQKIYVKFPRLDTPSYFSTFNEALLNCGSWLTSISCSGLNPLWFFAVRHKTGAGGKCRLVRLNNGAPTVQSNFPIMAEV
jgi:hypothetical protein